jgi:hypothetical protein
VINAKGLPVCKGGQLEARDTKAAKRVCGNAIVGEGKTTVEIAFPEQAPIPVKSDLLLFNGGTKGGKTTLFIHAFITVPTPAAIVTTVTLTKIHKGRYGIHTVSKIPVIAGGSGSVKSFSLQVKKIFTYKGKKQSYVSAKCPDGHFNANIISAKFDGGPTISGTVIRPCTSKG